MSAERAREIRRESGEAGPTRGLGAYVGSTRDPGALPGLPRPGAPPSFPPGPAPLSPRARPGLLRWPLCPLTPAPGSFTPSRGLLHTPPVPFRPPALTNDLSRIPPSTSLDSGTSDTASVSLVSGSGSTLGDYSSLRYTCFPQGLLAYLPARCLTAPYVHNYKATMVWGVTLSNGFQKGPR